MLFIKKFLFAAFIIFLADSAGFSQKITEKLIPGTPESMTSSPYDLKYDKKTGSYVYPVYDTSSGGMSVMTSKGISDEYEWIDLCRSKALISFNLSIF